MGSPAKTGIVGTWKLLSVTSTDHVEVASVPNWVNGDMVRFARLEGDRLTLKTPPLPRGGSMLTLELVWQRVK